MIRNMHMIMVGLAVMVLSATNGFAETIQLGLPEWGWGTTGLTTMSDTNTIHSARFTAYEDVTVDRVMQYFTGVDSTNTRLRIGIQSDSGGEPSGNWLNSVVIDPAEGNSKDFAVFGSVSLTNGYVYHVVTKFDTLGSGESFRIINAYYTYDTRPYDRRIDTNMQVVVSDNGGTVWSERNHDPLFIFANGSDTNIIQGPGNPYEGKRTTSTFSTRGGTGGAKGTRWQFASYEAGGYASVAVTNINIDVMAASSSQAPTNSLIIRVRESDGTILASATVPTNEVAGFKSYALDSQITLHADTPYLITTEFGGNGGTSSQYYYIHAIFADNSSFARAGYGGTNSVVPIQSYNRWSTFANCAEDWDMPFWFDAFPPPPPSGTVILIN